MGLSKKMTAIGGDRREARKSKGLDEASDKASEEIAKAVDTHTSPLKTKIFELPGRSAILSSQQDMLLKNAPATVV